jgi:Zn-dependent protease
MEPRTASEWLPPVAPGPSVPVAPPAPLASPGAEEAFGQPTEPRHRRAGSAILATLAAAAAKGKALLLLLPKLKLLTTSGSMLVSIGAYSLIWGWKFAAGFVVLLLIHEMGHVIQARREGLQASAPIFVPFLGAAIIMKSLGGNALAEARVGLAGPILGSAGAAALIPVADATGSDFWRALAFTGLFLNLFNLLPVVPLDGGRAMAAMSPVMWFVGLFALVALALAFPNPIILIIALLAGVETYRRWKARKDGDEASRAYYKVKPAHRLAVAVVYLGLIALLVVGMDATHVARTFADA